MHVSATLWSLQLQVELVRGGADVEVTEESILICPLQVYHNPPKGDRSEVFYKV